MVRPTFTYKEQPVRAGGLLIWTKVDGVRWNLFRKYKGKWQDIGGKTFLGDKNAMETVVREVCEETNDHLFSEIDTREVCSSKVLDLLGQKNRIHYDLRCKYLLFSCYVEPSVMALPMSRFGEMEGIRKHEYKWFSSFPKDRHFRLRKFK